MMGSVNAIYADTEALSDAALVKGGKGGSSAGRGGGEAERASKRFGVEGWSAKALAC